MASDAEREALFEMLRAQVDLASELVMIQSARLGEGEPFLPVLTPTVLPRSAAHGALDAESLAEREGAWTRLPVVQAPARGVTLRTDIGLALQQLVYVSRDDMAQWALPEAFVHSSAPPVPAVGRDASALEWSAFAPRDSVEGSTGSAQASRGAPSALPLGSRSDARAFHADPAFLNRFATAVDGAIDRYVQSMKL